MNKNGINFVYQLLKQGFLEAKIAISRQSKADNLYFYSFLFVQFIIFYHLWLTKNNNQTVIPCIYTKN